MPNVALVVLDTLRKDVFDEYFGWLPGDRFESAWSTSGWTVPAHGTLFTGRYPSECGVYAKHEALTYEGRTLAERLSADGYTTRGFSANANICDAFEFTRGFDEFRHSWRGRRRDEDVFDWEQFISRTRDRGPIRFPLAVKEAVLSDADTVKSLRMGLRMKARDLGVESIAGRDDGARKALEFVERTDFGDDEFLFLNLMEAHTPYSPPDSYRTVETDDVSPSFKHTMSDGPTAPEEIRRAYEDCARYLSDVYEKIFAELTAAFDYVITLSDHGEMFGRHGIWAHNFGVYPELTHVPLSVYTGSDQVTRREETVGLLDVHPTIVSMTGGEPDAPGRDLGSVSESGRYLVERHGLRTTRLEELTESGYDRETIERYDRTQHGIVREDGTYGWEGRTEFMSRPSADHRPLRRAIEELRDGLTVADVTPAVDRDVPDDVEDRLAELGYV